MYCNQMNSKWGHITGLQLKRFSKSRNNHMATWITPVKNISIMGILKNVVFYSSRIFGFKLIGPLYNCKLATGKKCSLPGDLQDIFRWNANCQMAFNSCQISTLSWAEQDIFFLSYIFRQQPLSLALLLTDYLSTLSLFLVWKGRFVPFLEPGCQWSDFLFPLAFPAGTGHGEAFCPATASSSGQIIQKHYIL